MCYQELRRQFGGKSELDGVVPVRILHRPFSTIQR